MKHALVTGAAGFIGSHLVDRLLMEGWRVTAIDNFDPFYEPQAKRRNLSACAGAPRFTLVEADIRDAVALQGAIPDGCDVIVHLAAKAGVRASIDNPHEYVDVNVQGTQSMLEWAKRRGVTQFVFASSSSVYGVNPDAPWREDDTALLPISPYAATKITCELMGHVYSHLCGMRFIALRIFSVYGPRQRPDLVIHKFARLMLKGDAVPLFGDGSTRRDYCYVDDVVTGIRRAIDYTASSYEVINLGNSHTVSLLEMIRELEVAIGVKARLDRRPPVPGDIPRTHADVRKARALLGFEPKMDFPAGIRKFLEWMKEQEQRPAHPSQGLAAARHPE